MQVLAGLPQGQAWHAALAALFQAMSDGCSSLMLYDLEVSVSRGLACH